MNKKISLIVAVACFIALTCIAAILQSGWTSTTNPATARTALGVLSATETTNTVMIVSSNSVGSAIPDVITLLNPTRIGVGQGATIWDGVPRTNGWCFYLPASTGIVRTISFQATQEHTNAWSRRDKIRMRVYADFTAPLTNTAVSNAAFIDVPLGTLVSDSFRFSSNGAYLSHRSTALLDVVVGWNSLNTNTVHFRLKTAMQFTNGVAIGFWDVDNARPFTNGYFSVAYETGPLNPQFAAYRTHIRSYALDPSSSSNAILLTPFSITNKQGLAIGWAESWGWIMSAADAATEDQRPPNDALSHMGEIPLFFQTGGPEITNANPMAASFKSYFDFTATSVWMSSGKDDFFHNSYAFTNAREWDGYDVGTPHRRLDAPYGIGNWRVAIQESYRWLIQDTFYFSNRLTITATHVPQTTNMMYRAMLITYEK